VFYEAARDLDSQPSPRTDHVEACVGETTANFSRQGSPPIRFGRNLSSAFDCLVDVNPCVIRSLNPAALSFAARIAGCCPFGSAPLSFESSGSMPPGSPASFPGWSRHLEAAFHSPKTTVRLRTAISRSKFPTYFFDTPPNIRQARSVSDSPARSGSPRYAQDRYQKPVARLLSGSPNRSSDLHSPLGPFGPISFLHVYS
jgi:hypothetical protein